MKALELRQKSKEELETLLRGKRVHLEELARLIEQKKIKNVREHRSEKKDVARILTILSSLT